MAAGVLWALAACSPGNGPDRDLEATVQSYFLGMAAEAPAGEPPKAKRPGRPRAAPADAPVTPDAAE